MPYQRTINPTTNVSTFGSSSRVSTVIPPPVIPPFLCESLYFAPPQWSSIDAFVWDGTKWTFPEAHERGVLTANTSWSNSGFQPTDIVVTLTATNALPTELPFTVDVTPREFTGQPQGTAFAVFNTSADVHTLTIPVSYSQPSRYIADLLIESDIYVTGPDIVCIDVII